MPKAKSHSGAKKRFGVTGSGLATHKSTNRRHILSGKSPKRKRNLRGNKVVFAGEQIHIRQMLLLRSPK